MKANTYETEPVILPYPETTMYGAVKRSAEKYPKAIAYDFMGKQTSYAKMIQNVDCAARALVASGIHRGDAVTICMPNTPQAIVCLYALNRIGAVANMIHPFSSQKERYRDSDRPYAGRVVSSSGIWLLAEKGEKCVSIPQPGKQRDLERFPETCGDSNSAAGDDL